MKNFKKIYIGKGTQVEDMDMVTVNIDMDQASEFIFEYDGKKYLRFEVARMKETSQYGKTHTCYVSKLEEADEPATLNEAAANSTGGKAPRKKRK